MTKAVNEGKKNFYFDADKQDEEDMLLEQLMGGQEIYNYKQTPTEDHLVSNTLWPELNKMYGHEISCLVTSSSGKHIASCCKSQSFKHSAILIWDPVTYLVNFLKLILDQTKAGRS